MSASLELDDLMRLGQGSFDELARAGSRLDPRDNAAQAAFARQVIAVETVLKQTWQAVALLARRTPSCEQTAEVWQSMRDFADRALATLSGLRDRYPGCGTAGLHDLALDYRAAAEKRSRENLEAASCRQTPLPEGVLPPLTSPA
jgi:hypothetical protein